MGAHKMADVYHKIVGAGVDNAKKKINSGNFKNHLNGKGANIIGCGVRNGSYYHRKNDIAKGCKNCAEKVKSKGWKIGFIIGHKTAEKAGFSHFLIHDDYVLSDEKLSVKAVVRFGNAVAEISLKVEGFAGAYGNAFFRVFGNFTFKVETFRKIFIKTVKLCAAAG
jgi:hypothetical protein